MESPANLMIFEMPPSSRRRCEYWRVIDAQTGQKICDAEKMDDNKVRFNTDLIGDRLIYIEGYDIEYVRCAYEIDWGKYAILYHSGFTVFRDDKNYNEPRETNVIRSTTFKL